MRFQPGFISNAEDETLFLRFPLFKFIDSCFVLILYKSDPFFGKISISKVDLNPLFAKQFLIDDDDRFFQIYTVKSIAVF